jgi:hypothetical protein
MKNKFIIILLFSLLGCKNKYIKNHFYIKSFNVSCSDSIKNGVIINFDIAYYSDSTKENYFENSIQKGLDGSNHDIIFFGYDINENSKDPEDLKLESFENFKHNYNQKKDMYNGEMLEKEFILESNKDCASINEKIILVRRNTTTNKIDTLIANQK